MNKKDDVLQIDTRIFFNRHLDRLTAISGRQRQDLMPDNLYKLMPLDKKFSPKIRCAERLTYCVAKAISKCQDKPKKPFKTILICAYLQEIPDYEIRKRVGYSHSRYSELKRMALEEFTKYFNYLIKEEGISSSVELIN